jgi:hypothetical protein
MGPNESLASLPFDPRWLGLPKPGSPDLEHNAEGGGLIGRSRWRDGVLEHSDGQGQVKVVSAPQPDGSLAHRTSNGVMLGRTRVVGPILQHEDSTGGVVGRSRVLGKILEHRTARGELFLRSRTTGNQLHHLDMDGQLCFRSRLALDPGMTGAVATGTAPPPPRRRPPRGRLKPITGPPEGARRPRDDRPPTPAELVARLPAPLRPLVGLGVLIVLGAITYLLRLFLG